MFRKFILLVALLPVQVFAQAVDYYVTPYTTQQSKPNLEYINQSQGTATSLGDDSTTGQIQLGFDFTFYNQNFSSAFLSSNGLISFQNPINGCCNGYNLASSGNQYSIFALQTDLINIQTSNPYYKTLGEEGSRRFVVGWYDMPEFYNSAYRSTFEITLFEGSNNILLNYDSINLSYGRTYTSGIKGSNTDGYELIYSGNDSDFLDFSAYLFSSSPPPPPLPEVLFWSRIAGENESFTLMNEAQVRYGANGVWTTLVLSPGTYSCSNSLFGDPLGGVVKSCEIGMTEPVLDCTSDPYNTQCLVNDFIDNEPETATEIIETIDDETVTEVELVAEVSDTNEEEINEDTVAVEETEEETVTEDVAQEDTLEELLTDDTAQEERTTDNNETNRVDILQLVNEEKANELSDSIPTNTLELVLATETTTTTSATTASTNDSGTASTKTSTTTSQMSTQDTLVSESKSEEMKQETSESSSSEALELLETGRNLGQQALASTLEQSKESASDSMNQAETIAVTSNETANSVSINNLAATNEIDDNISNATMSSVVTDTSEVGTNEINSVDTSEIVIADVQNTESQTDTSVNDGFVDITNSEINPNVDAYTQEEDEVVAKILSETTRQEEQINNGSMDDEQITIQNDPTLANAFNVVPNTTNLEMLGVLGKQEDKSDAEKKADEIVAANAKEQEEINNNYMEADQSGIIGAMVADTDVSSYNTKMIPDMSDWYKPEDIYKNILYKDNVRGMYFLEKGNTDTYKKLVDLQYNLSEE